MDVVTYHNQEFIVEEVSRPMWGVILYKALGSRDMYLVYLVSTGPYKIDIPNVYKLSVNEVTEYNSNTLNLEFLCERLLSYAT